MADHTRATPPSHEHQARRTAAIASGAPLRHGVESYSSATGKRIMRRCKLAARVVERTSDHRTCAGRKAYPPRNRCSFGMPVLASSFCSSNSRPTDCRRRLVALSPPAGGRHTTGATLPPAAALIKRRLAGAATDLQQTVVLKRNLQLLHAYRQSPGASLHLPARRNALSKLGS